MDISVTSPYDHHVVGSVKQSDAKEVEAFLARAYQTHLAHKEGLPITERIQILEKFYDLMQKNKDELIRLSASEGGKPYVDTEIEVNRAMNGVKVAIEHIPQLTGKEIPMRLNASSVNRMAHTFKLPVGVVFAISAFNHPVNLIIHQVIPAIATGCPVIVKPASSTALSCFKLVELLHEAGLDPKWCTAFLCDNEVASNVVSDERVSFLSFIGSAKVGWMLRSKLAPGAHCALEHGGVAPVILDQGIDLDPVIPALTKSGFYHAGQVCVSLQRLYVHESLLDELIEKFTAAVKQLKVGDPLDPKTEVGPLISTREVDRIDEWVQEAIQQGATCLCGGKKLDNNCYAPTLLLNPPESATISQQEVFGPVVAIYSVPDLDTAIAKANALPVFFQSALFTDNLHHAIKGARQLNATAVMINDHSAFRVDWMPFGGRMQSGLAMGGIPYSMHDMSYEKMMVLKSPEL